MEVVELMSSLFTAQGKRVVYGTDDGVYISNLWERNREPVKVLALQDVSQVDVLEDYQLLIVLSGESVRNYGADCHTERRHHRTTSDHFPTGRIGPYGSYVRSQTCQTDSVPYFLLQSRCMSWQDPRLCSEGQSIVKYHQDPGAN